MSVFLIKKETEPPIIPNHGVPPSMTFDDVVSQHILFSVSSMFVNLEQGTVKIMCSYAWGVLHVGHLGEMFQILNKYSLLGPWVVRRDEMGCVM